MGASASLDAINQPSSFKNGARTVTNKPSMKNRDKNNRNSIGKMDPPEANIFKNLVGTKFSFETAYPKIDIICRDLLKFKTARTEEITPALDFLFTYTANKYGSEICSMWVEKLERNNIVEIVMQLWPSFWDPDFLQVAAESNLPRPESDDSTNKPSYAEINKNNATLENFWFVCRILWNGTDCSVTLCKSLVERGAVEQMLTILSRSDFDAKNIKKDEVRSYIAKAAMGILHNCLRYCRQCRRALCAKHASLDAQNRFHNFPGTDVIIPYLQSNMLILTGKATIILAESCNEDNYSKIIATANIVKGMIEKLIKPALQRQTHRIQNFIVCESIEACNNLANIEAAKYEFVKQGMIDVYQKILDNNENDDELVASLKNLWLISFDNNAAQEILRSTHLINGLQSFKWHTKPSIYISVKGILWNINGRKGFASDSAVRKRRGHNAQNNSASRLNTTDRSKLPGAMPNTAYGTRDRTGEVRSADDQKRTTANSRILISNHRDDEDFAIELCQSLQERNFDINLTNNRMCATNLESIIDSIENGAAVIVIGSKFYQFSAICRTEAEYALLLRKPILPIKYNEYNATGWMQKIIGSKPYTHSKDRSKADFDRLCDRIVKELNARVMNDKKKAKEGRSQSAEVTNGKNEVEENEDKLKTELPKEEAELAIKLPLSHTSSTSSRQQSAINNEGTVDARYKQQSPIDKGFTSLNSVDKQLSSQSSIHNPLINRKPNLSSWSTEDVQEWLNESRLGHVAHEFCGIDGSLLIELKHMYDKAPNVTKNFGAHLKSRIVNVIISLICAEVFPRYFILIAKTS